MDLPKRKPNRLPYFDYSTPGAYFLTICTEKKTCILGTPDAPFVPLSKRGKLVQQYIKSGNNIPDVTDDKYVVMPNHVHIFLFVDENSLLRLNMKAVYTP